MGGTAFAGVVDDAADAGVVVGVAGSAANTSKLIRSKRDTYLMRRSSLLGFTKKRLLRLDL